MTEIVLLLLPSMREWKGLICSRWAMVGLLAGSVLRKYCRVAFPKEEGLENGPDGCIVPMLAKDVCWVLARWEVVRPCDTGSLRFPYPVEGERVVALV